ncbi:MAG: YihY/virulence factor BrkB family protein [Bacteroidales bacterium]|nr:YihY/virulence factor BrkB family protein [Bacteroidales bacterium]MBS3774257.1 YihY/virulence factor BrkB family protein [Bacteroidales bacterium]
MDIGKRNEGIINLIKRRSKRISLPGFYSIPLYEVIKFFIDGLKNGALTTRASSVAFNFVLAMFPGIIFLFTLIPYIPIDNFQTELLNVFQNILPQNAFNLLKSTLVDIIMTKNWGLLSFGALASLFFSMNGIHALIDAFNSTHHYIETRSWITQRLISLGLVFILATLITSATLLIILSRTVLNMLVEQNILEYGITLYLILIGQWVIIILFHLLAISFIYYLAPAKRPNWNFFSPGAIFATFLTIMASVIFSLFINNFGQLNKLYGSIGTLMVVLIWTYFNSLALILGFELNASISSAKIKSKYS